MKNGNGSLKLEKGIPVPKDRARSEVLLMMRAMKVGDSFVYPKANRTIFSNYAGRAGIKVITRSVSETEVRVWRVK